MTDIEKKFEELEKKFFDLEKKFNNQRINNIATGINSITAVTLSDVSGTPNSGDGGTDTIITNLMTQNNAMNGQVDLLVSTVNKILQNTKDQ